MIETIEDLYKWAVKHDCEKATLVLSYWDSEWDKLRYTASREEPYYKEDKDEVII